MKRIILFFTVCLGLSISGTTFADNEDAVRAATKRAQNQTVSATTNSTNTTNRSVSSNTRKTENIQNKNSRTAIKSQPQKVVSRTSTKNQNVKPRTTIQQPTKQTATSQTTKRVNTPSRQPTNARTLSVNKLPITVSSNRTARSAVKNAGKRTAARTAELDSTKISNIKSLDYSKCKTVYYECMDEFCANKDSNLRRCACSARIHEFDNIKQQLNDAEDRMNEFNQRLLTVSMDKEDAAALNIATEGETAFQITDKTESEKLLQKITDSLNSSSDSKINNNLSAISLSLDMDSAWDNIDSMSGIATTAKSGVDLYNAAQPICIEMAKEVCNDEELSIAQDGYKLTIQQDCNTVAKSYNTLYNNAMTKIHESGALLDISRLTNYQQRNSDDILTCKKKILEQLSDTSVCGKNLYKCLDMTGEYIDPSNGNAFLSGNLYNLSTLLKEPTGDEKWSKIKQNEPFVDFLNAKKEFLDPAIKQCEDISDTVWKEFLDDALAQIKLAQNAKMEEIRQGCTTLVAECKTNALTDLTEFDSRALSLFSVSADKTANAMCSDIQNSCVALINYMGSTDWESGMVGIATDISYDTLMDTCAQIGRDCIIQKCNGTSGNFALCKNTTSAARKDILTRAACWEKVHNCVQSADNLANMHTTNTNPDCNNDIACLLTEEIWGSCTGTDQDATIVESDSSLLSWFATNTGNETCNLTGCPLGYQLVNNTCMETITEQTDDCGTATLITEIIHVTSNLTNYCANGVHDSFGNCCVDGFVNNGICVNSNATHAILLLSGTCSQIDPYYCPDYTANTTNPRTLITYCITTDSNIEYNATTDEYTCNGVWIMVDQYGNYLNLQNQTGAPTMSYKPNCTNVCTYNYSNNSWSFGNCTEINTSVPTTNQFLITYQ